MRHIDTNCKGNIDFDVAMKEGGKESVRLTCSHRNCYSVQDTYGKTERDENRVIVAEAQIAGADTVRYRVGDGRQRYIDRDTHIETVIRSYINTAS